jgi:hypothetical protein
MDLFVDSIHRIRQVPVSLFLFFLLLLAIRYFRKTMMHLQLATWEFQKHFIVSGKKLIGLIWPRMCARIVSNVLNVKKVDLPDPSLLHYRMYLLEHPGKWLPLTF